MIRISCSILILLSALSSCNSIDGEELIGVYTSELKNNADTLTLHANGVYARSLYNKKNLVFSQKGEWDYEDGRLHLTEFFIDLDKKYGLNYNFNNVLMGLSTAIEWNKGRLIFRYGPYEHDRFYYVKVN